MDLIHPTWTTISLVVALNHVTPNLVSVVPSTVTVISIYRRKGNIKTQWHFMRAYITLQQLR